MADDTLVVNFVAMEHASHSIQSALSKLHSRLEEASNLGKRLTASWEGEAKDSYQIRQANWERAGADLANMLKDIKRALDDSIQRYAETEKRNKAMFPSKG